MAHPKFTIPATEIPAMKQLRDEILVRKIKIQIVKELIWLTTIKKKLGEEFTFSSTYNHTLWQYQKRKVHIYSQEIQ